MVYTISGKGIQITDKIRLEFEDSFDKLSKFFKEDTQVNIVVTVERDRKRVEVTIPLKGHTIRAEQESNDLFVTIDMTAEVIERQIKKYKGKIIASKHNAESLTDIYLTELEAENDQTIRITRSKKVLTKPMYPEDACIQMDLLGHAFFVFRNADTDEINVVYKKKDSTFGLIEPEN